MRKLSPIFLICLSVLLASQISGCAVLPFSRPSEEVDLDPIATMARKLRSPSASPETSGDRPWDNSSNSFYSDTLYDAQQQQAAQELARQQAISAARKRGDLVLGMMMSDVLGIWGQPAEVETAGAPGLGYERWIYFEGLSSRLGMGQARYVYFEKGAVAGWESR